MKLGACLLPQYAAGLLPFPYHRRKPRWSGRRAILPRFHMFHHHDHRSMTGTTTSDVSHWPTRPAVVPFFLSFLLAVFSLLPSVLDAFHHHPSPPSHVPVSTVSPSQGCKPHTTRFISRLSASKTDYYSVLGLSPGATPAEVKRAFRERAKTTHPDSSRSADTTQEFLAIKEAYETLYDARRRAEFDRRRQLAEVADLAVSVGEILTRDVAVPLGKEWRGRRWSSRESPS